MCAAQDFLSRFPRRGWYIHACKLFCSLNCDLLFRGEVKDNINFDLVANKSNKERFIDKTELHS